MTDAWTAMEATRAQAETRYTWHRLFRSLKKWIVVCGRDVETDKQLEEMSITTEWWHAASGDGGPEADIVNAFRENADLWLSACPVENVVILPKEIFARIIGALPPKVYFFAPDAKLGHEASGIPQMSADEWERIGREQLAQYAHVRRTLRERAEHDARLPAAPLEKDNG